MKTALITGVTGQDGSYLADLLLYKGYMVHGIMRRSSVYNTLRIDHILQQTNFKLHFGDLADGTSISKLVEEINPDEIYNLGAMSHVRVSYEQPVYTMDVTATAVTRLLETIKNTRVRFYQASSSEMFGSTNPPQSEASPFHPRSPYGVAKVAAYWAVRNYRESYGVFASNGILFNHESPRRGENFVTRKITLGLGKILRGEADGLTLGNLEARRDWGFAGDYVEAMWRMLQHDEPDDFVIATGEAYSVKDFLTEAFSQRGLGWPALVSIDPKLFRPAEVDFLLGDASKARQLLGWTPRTSFKQLVKMMVDHDCGPES